MRAIPSRRNQRGVATLLFITLIAVGMAGATAAVFQSTQGAQKMQHAEHTITQAEMSAWAGVSLLSKAMTQVPSTAEFTPGGNISFDGAQPGLSARYVEKRAGLHVFEVTGSSAGARSVVRAALRPPSAPSAGGGNVSLPGGATLHGTTTLEGSVQYTGGAGSRNLYVLDGSLTLQGSVSGLEQVCATGDVEVNAAIQVGKVCSNGNVTFKGAASVTEVTAVGNVTLSGGASTAIGTLHSNGKVTLSGGSAAANSVLASGDVVVSGGAARANDIVTQGNIDWTSSATAATLKANGTVNYRPSGTSVATDIESSGYVMVTSARNVRTSSGTTLVGYYGQGITGRLDSQGLLGGAAWGAYGGAVVKAGTVGSIVSPYPSTVKVTVSPGYAVSVPLVVVPTVATFAKPKVTVDAYALQDSANFSFLGTDGSGNVRVKVAKVNGVPDGAYFIAANATGLQNYLCKTVVGTTCAQPLMKVCQGYSNYNKCFSYNGTSWTIEGSTMLPGVLWFEGNVLVSNGTWVNTFLSTGDITTGGSVKLYSPNYIGSAYACRGEANSARSLQAWTAYGFTASAYAMQLCSGSPPELSAAAVGNVALLAGGFQNGAFKGGNVTLGASNEIYGSVLAGQYLTTSGSTTLAGSIYSAAQGGSAASKTNRQSGSTTIRLDGGSTAYNPDAAPCMTGCQAQPVATASNVVWASPV